MNINTARFLTSSPSAAKCPSGTPLHEYAFIGRSNVGKSSLINMLLGRKDLAKTSSTPGKTMLINYFLVNDSWYIVDLPGYGFAMRSKDDRRRLEAMIKDYILNREQMTCLFVLVDSRHAPQKIDLEFMEFLGENGVPFAIVFTKLDKLKAGEKKKNINAYCQRLLETWEELPPIFATSSEDRRGRVELLDYIEQLNSLPLENVSNENDSVINNKGIMDKKDEKLVDSEKYRGADIDIADDEKVSSQRVDNDVKELNDNPRSDDGPDPYGTDD